MGLFDSGSLSNAAKGSLFGAPGTLAGAVGLGGKEGQYYQGGAVPGLEQSASKAVSQEGAYAQDPRLAAAIQDYGNGANIEEQIQNRFGLGEQQAARRSMVEDPMAGTKYATEQVQGNPLLAGLYGKGGLQDSLQSEYGKYDTNGGLTEQNQTELGQAYGNIARQSGQQEQALAQSLASRGLGGGPSGTAGVAYSGLQGNKFENLANWQTKIANQQLEQKRALATQRMQLGQQAGNELNNQYGRNASGTAAARANQQAGASAENTRNSQMLQSYGLQQQADLASNQDKRAAYEPGLADAFKAGLMGSASNVGQAPGKFVSGFAGSAGAGAGKGA